MVHMTEEQRKDILTHLEEAREQDTRDAALDRWHQAARGFEEQPVSDTYRELLLAAAEYQAEYLRQREKRRKLARGERLARLDQERYWINR